MIKHIKKNMKYECEIVKKNETDKGTLKELSLMNSHVQSGGAVERWSDAGRYGTSSFTT